MLGHKSAAARLHAQALQALAREHEAHILETKTKQEAELTAKAMRHEEVN